MNPIRPITVPGLGETFGLKEIGDYEIIEELGRGGMGVVFKARQRSLNRVVAIKMILGRTLANETDRLRFRREAELIAALNHPNIVDIYEISEFEGRPFYSMEYIEGTTLKELIKDKPLRWMQAARFAQMIAQAMQFAHDRGVIHRDLKPHNVMVDPHQNVHVTDFGLARDLNTDSGLTIKGEALGTPNYMSPEQCEADLPLSAATDIYAIGAIIYEMATSIPPFMGSNVHDLLDKVKNAIPLEPRLINPSIPRDLNTICLKCLQKDPVRRYLTSAELAEELDRVLRDEPIKAKPVSPAEKGWRWCRRNRVLASVIIGSTMVIIAAAITAMVEAHLTRIALDETEIHREAAVALNLLDSSPAQGLRLALCAADDCVREFGAPFSDVQESLTAALNRASELTWLDPGYANLDRAAFSGDGKRVAMAGDGRLTLFDLGSGKKLCVFAASPGVKCAALALDVRGGLIASAGKDGSVRWWNSVGLLLGKLPSAAPGWVTALSFSPDGTKIVTAGTDLRPHLWDLQGNELPVHFAAQHANPLSCLLFSPDGGLIASADNTGTDCTIQLSNLDGTLSGPPITAQDSGVTCLAFSPDGKILASSGADSIVRFWNRSGAPSLPPLSAPGNVQTLGFSPDGKEIAIAASAPKAVYASTGTVSLWNADGQQQHDIFPIDHHLRVLAFGPGDTLAMVGDDRLCRVHSLLHLQPRAGFMLGYQTNDIAVLQDGKTIVSGADNGAVAFSSYSNTQVAPTLEVAKGGSGTMPRFELSPARDLLGIAVKGLPIFQLWSYQNGWTEFKSIDNHAPIDGFAFSATSGRVVTGMNDKIWVRDLAGKLIAQPVVDSRSIIGRVSFSPDGKFFAAANIPDVIPVWNSDGNAVASIGTEGLGAVSVLTFSPDGKQLAVAFLNGFVALYDTNSFKRTVPLMCLGKNGITIRSIAFSPDSQKVACGGWTPDGAILQIWDAKGNPLTPPIINLPAADSLIALCFTPDGKTLLTADLEGKVKFWAADWSSWMDLACARLRNHPIIQTREAEANKAKAIIARRFAVAEQ